MRAMTENNDLLSEVEKAFKERFTDGSGQPRVQSTAHEVTPSERVGQLVLPEEKRGRMPFTKDKYVIRENPHDIQWEREVRKFLVRLSITTGHRISATMIYEWVTGIPVKELVDAGDPPNGDLRRINKILRFYFGKAYQTYIMGRKVPNCYKVKPGYRIKRHRPMTMALLAEYYEKVLNP